MTDDTTLDWGPPSGGRRLFLSSTRLDEALSQRFVEFVDRGRAAVVANALDGMPEGERAWRVQSELEMLSRLGFDATELDLRDHFASVRTLGPVLTDIDLLWVRGGNAFVLRSAMALSGCDRILRALLPRGMAYAGYSAGSCVVGSTLVGLELADDPALVQRAHSSEVEWRGVGFLDRAIVPHCGPPDDPRAGVMEQVVSRHRRDGRACVTLRDGQALLVRDEGMIVI